MMAGFGRNLVFTCLISLLLWRAEAISNSTLEDGALTAAPKAAPATGTVAPAAALTNGTGAPTAAPATGTVAPAAAPTTGTGAPTAAPTTGTTPGTASQGTVIDVTKYGAVGDGKTDNKKAFTDAWAIACKSTAGPSTFLVPQGEFLVSSVVFSGPCNSTQSSPNVEIKGKLVATSGTVSNCAWIVFQFLNQLNISGFGTGVLDGKGETVWTTPRCSHNDPKCGMLPTTLQFASIKGGSLSDITLTNSKAFHSVITNCSDLIIHDVKIIAPKGSPNTDGVHIGDSTGITISKTAIETGDDCISIGSGSSNINITEVQCALGHGISVGSLGRYPKENEVKTLRVTNCNLTNTSNGVRIKTWPGAPDNKVSDVRFENIVMTNVSNPILIDQKYCDGKCDKTVPSRVKLSDIHYKNITGTSFTKAAVTLTCSEGIGCENVELIDINFKSTVADGNVTAACVNVKGAASGVQTPSGCL